MVNFDELRELGVDGLLNGLGWEREEGDRSEVLEVCLVLGRLLQQGVDLGVFPIVWEGGSCSVEDVVRARIRLGS